MAMVHVSPTELQLSCPEEVGNEASTPLREVEHFDLRPERPRGVTNVKPHIKEFHDAGAGSWIGVGNSIGVGQCSIDIHRKS
jgi:hypothetical protein